MRNESAKSTTDEFEALKQKIDVLEKEVAFWKDKALSFRKPHSH